MKFTFNPKEVSVMLDPGEIPLGLVKSRPIIWGPETGFYVRGSQSAVLISERGESGTIQKGILKSARENYPTIAKGVGVSDRTWQGWENGRNIPWSSIWNIHVFGSLHCK